MVRLNLGFPSLLLHALAFFCAVVRGFRVDSAKVTKLVEVAGKDAITVLTNVGNPLPPQVTTCPSHVL